MSLATSSKLSAQISTQTYTPSHQYIAQLEQLYQERSLIPCAAGQPVHLHPNRLYVVCRGMVQLHTIHADGNDTIVGLCGSSMAFGHPLTGLAPYWATALVATDILPLSLSEVESSPTLAAGVFPQVVRRLQQTEAWLALSGKRLVADRLKGLIVQLAQDFGQVGTDGVRINVRLTHHQLATIIGTTRVTVTRLLRDFRAQGWLNVRQRRLIVSRDELGVS